MILALGDARPVLEGGGHFIADDARVIGRVRLGARVSVWFGATLRGDNDWIEVGRDSNVQDGATLHTDPGLTLVVGERATVGHRAVLHGCVVGDGSLVGIGATLLNGARIGRECLVGAHALVPEGKSFPDGVLIVGAPARIVRELDAAERARLAESAAAYVANGKRYREGLAAATGGAD